MRKNIALIAGLTIANSVAATVEIAGEWVQGGLLHGQTEPGARVEVLGHQVYVDTQGRFIFGLGRDVGERITLTETSASGVQTDFHFRVTQRDYAVQRIEGVEPKYVEPPPAVLARIAREDAEVKRARQTLRPQRDYAGGFSWPLHGEITGVYGSQRVFNGVPKRPHFGLDIAGPVGATVSAPAPGLVTLANPDMYYSGGTLLIDHGQGLSSTFIHLSKILVKAGEYVERGQAIAEVGATGRATGPHLDWRINWFNQRLDPFPLLPPVKAAPTAR